MELPAGDSKEFPGTTLIEKCGVEVRMHQQKRWLPLPLCILLPAVLLPATQKDKLTSSGRNTVAGAKIFNTIVPRVMELMGEGMDRLQSP